MSRILLSSICALFFVMTYAQKTQYPFDAIADSLKVNANAVLRLDENIISIESQQKMTVLRKKVITILNDDGFSKGDFICYYSKSTKVKNVKFTVIDATGTTIKSYKKSDFKDMSVGDGFSIFNDDRLLYLDFTPTQYPVTIIFEAETETSNTAFIPRWYAVPNVAVGIERSAVKISYPNDLGFDYREENFSAKYKIIKNQQTNTLLFEANNIIAQKAEEWSPNFFSLVPQVLFRVKKFNLEGLNGQADSWKELGAWYFTNLLNDTSTLSPETIGIIKNLVGKDTDAVVVAKKIYQYVQDKTRYVSIQVGIGGFKPMSAMDVDRLGYGDCKALSNYTRCLLEAVGIKSYYTVIYAGSKKDFTADFASTQGNHAILALPVDNKYVFMECTSQTNPFGYQGDFTDNRMALIVKPEGGELVRTNSYADLESTQITNGKYSIDAEGKLEAKIVVEYKGVQYEKYAGLERQSKKIQIEKKTQQYNNINNLAVTNLTLKNDRETITFTEEMDLTAKNYADAKDNIMFAVNAFNNNSPVPKRYRKREFPFEIDHGFLDIDDISITLPENFVLEAMPSNANITSKFGEYKTEIGVVKNNIFTYKRSLKIKSGRFDDKDYNNFRLFMEQIARNDNAKILLKKK